MNFDLRPSVTDWLLGLCYFLAASAAVLLTRFDGGVAFLWIASPLLIAVLMVRPRRHWGGPLLACVLGSMAATGLFGLGWHMALPFAALNMAEAYVAARLFRQFGYSRQPLGSISWLMHFIVCAGLAGPIVGATLASAALWTEGRPLGTTFIQFFAGHALGNLAFIPVATLIVTGSLGKSLRLSTDSRKVEVALLLSVVAVTAAAVFAENGMPLLFLPMLPIILVTFRLGQGAAALSIMLLALIGGGLTLAGRGPIQLLDAELGVRMQFFQLYLAATVLTILPVAADLRNRSRLHAELRTSEARYRLLADHSTDVILHMEPDGLILYASPSIRQLGGYDPHRIEGRNIMMLVPPEGRDDVEDGHQATIEAAGRTHSYRHLAMTAAGDRRWFESHCRVLLDDAGRVEGILSVARDISRQVAVEDSLSIAAMTDPLTGLANRRAFRTAVEQTLEAGQAGRDCLALFDIDHFKRVNDDFGHDAGDDVIRAFAGVARRMVREGDLVARLGGEEFAVHFPRTSVEQAVQICERIRVEMAETATFIGDMAVHVTISGGVAQIGKAGIDAALKAADDALYISKRNGRDQLSLAA